MISADFIADFKHKTEERWKHTSLDRSIYGFQFQRGTRWNPGLSASEISEYERSLEIDFPYDFAKFLSKLNGTDLPTLNIYGDCGEPYRESVGVYSYPKDLERVGERIERLSPYWGTVLQTLAEEGLELPNSVKFMPIYAHRYVVCLPDRSRSEVVSIMDDDAIVYGSSLEQYLTKEFLSKLRH